MTESAHGLLSHDELEAILASVSKRERAPDGGGASRRGSADLRSSALNRSLQEFADERSRLLSTLHQRAIGFAPLVSELLPSAEFVGAMNSLDRVALFEFLPDGEMGALLVGRSLLYGWLTMALGGPAGTPLAIPDRQYSPIEQRFLRGIAGELAKGLETCFSRLRPVEIRLRGLVEPHLVPGATSPRLWVASFAAEGFGDVARLRVGLPDAWVDALQRRPGGSDTRKPDDIRSRLLDMPLHLRAEIGSAELSLRRVAALQPGDVLEIDPVEGGDVLVRLEDRPKFRAIPGALGSALAVQLTEEVK